LSSPAWPPLLPLVPLTLIPQGLNLHSGLFPLPSVRTSQFILHQLHLSPHCLVFMSPRKALPPTSPYVPGSNASGLAVVACSVLPAGSMPAVPSAMAGEVPMTSSAPPSYLYVSTPKCSTSLASQSVLAFTTVLASLRGSGDTGALATDDHAPSSSPRSSQCERAQQG